MSRYEQQSDESGKVTVLPAPKARRPKQPRSPERLLIVEDDQELAVLLAEHLAETLRLEISVAHDCHQAVDAELSKPHDLILADVMLPDGDALGLMRQLGGITAAGFLLMSGVPTIGRVIEALRLGALDFLTKPFELSQLTAAVSEAMARHRQRAAMEMRYRRMRRLAKRIVQDRRQLRQRVDLVCRDLVQAYRRLAKRVVELYELYGYQQND